jgi:succinate-semialdehyde dehydrogenase/glutarate-semialdehyde dehydrogenase
MPTTDSPLSRLRDPSLLKTDALINGEWVTGADRFPVTDPSTGQELAKVANMTDRDALLAVEAADKAWSVWRRKTAKERSNILRAWYNLIMANQDDLARIMTAEQGKPFPEAKGEVTDPARFVEWFAEEAKRVNG